MAKKSLEMTGAVSSDIKRVKDSDGTDTSLNLSSSKALVSGDFEVAGGYKGIMHIDGQVKSPSNSDITLDAGGDINLDAAGNDINFRIGSAENYLNWNSITGLTIKSILDLDDYFNIKVESNAGTIISTENDSGDTAHMTLQPKGSIELDPDTGKTIINGTEGLYFDGGGDTYIHEVSADKLEIVVGADEMLTLDEANQRVTVEADKLSYSIAGGTEWGATDSAYAGHILGYTRLQGDLTSQSVFEIQNSMTVEDSTHQITFKTPPSENVEIEAAFLIDVLSTDTELHAGLSDNSTYNSIGEQFEYDAVGVWFSDDEASDKTCVVKWVLEAGQLESIGSNNTFWIGFSTAGSTKTAYLKYGLRASHGLCDHPFVIKATALPVAIYDGQ